MKNQISCSMCGRKVIFRVKGGKPHSDKDHDLCAECWRNEQNKNRALEFLRSLK